MTAYPPEEWDILPAEEFMTASARDTTKQLTSEAFIQVDDEGKASGHFRIVLGKRLKQS